MPIQERFLKENDDVRTGIIKNMAEFWNFLSPEKREEEAKVRCFRAGLIGFRACRIW